MSESDLDEGAMERYEAMEVTAQFGDSPQYWEGPRRLNFIC